jgi:hypothetical protein
MAWIDELHATLDQRATPEQVAQVIRAGDVAGSWPPAVRTLLNRAAAAHAPWYVSSMPADFARADDCRVQLAAVGRMFGEDVSHVDPADRNAISVLIAELGSLLGGWHPGDDWKADRLSKEDRRTAPSSIVAQGLVAKRQYNRHVRVLRHLWDKAMRMGGAQHQRELILIGRSGFASRITAERFRADPLTACFIAYFTARKNRRRLFTLAAKENPIDQLAQCLLALAVRQAHTDWEMLAWVYPRPAVLARLAPGQLGALLGDWHAVMASTAVELKAAWPGDEQVNRATMAVRRGMDSSTWNTMAQAYNAARSAWLSCVAASGALPLIEPALPGKVMRLMAADLVYWHRSSGGDVDPNTSVWCRLPLPWQVLEGTHPCTAADVREACREAGLDAETSGWTAPLPDGAPAQFTPTPDLVHGIAVSDPAWAAVLRRGGAFSGKGIKNGYEAAMAFVPPEVITGPRPVYDQAGTYMGVSTELQEGNAAN